MSTQPRNQLEDQLLETHLDEALSKGVEIIFSRAMGAADAFISSKTDQRMLYTTRTADGSYSHAWGSIDEQKESKNDLPYLAN